MNLSTQLRVILLIAGVMLLAAIYYWGRRKAPQRHVAMEAGGRSQSQRDLAFEDEPEADEPSAPLVNQDFSTHAEEPASRAALDDLPPMYAEVPADTDWHRGEEHTVSAFAAESAQAEHTLGEWAHEPELNPAQRDAAVERTEPMLSRDTLPMSASNNAPTVAATSDVPASMQPVAPANIPTIDESLATASRRNYQPAPAVSNVAPTLSEPVRPRIEPSVQSTPPSATQKAAAKPASRKIVALRVAVSGERVAGAQLLQLFAAERLQHGKFDIFHRLHQGQIVFSVASMVEPGSFDPAAMPEQQFPGVTLFALLPGPVDAIEVFNQMLECADHLSQATHAMLQDERGAKLTPHSIERLREEVLDFQHLLGAMTVP